MESFQESVRRAAQEASGAPVRHAAVYRHTGPAQLNALASGITAVVALVRWRRTGAPSITVALTDHSALLLDTRVRRGRRVARRRIAELPIDSIRCRLLPEQPWAFELEAADGERWRLFPRWDTPDVVAIAERLCGT